MQLKAWRYLLLAGLTIVSASVLLAIGTVGALGDSVQQDAYPLNVSPISGCIGSNITYSGSAAPPNAPVVVFFLSDVPVFQYLQSGLQPSVELDISGTVLGLTTSNAGGGWSLSAPVPATVEKMQINGDDGIQVPVTPGNWQILAASMTPQQPDLEKLDPQQAVYIAQGSLDVINCTVAFANTMPSTGTPSLFLGVMGTLLLVLGGLGFLAHRRSSSA